MDGVVLARAQVEVDLWQSAHQPVGVQTALLQLLLLKNMFSSQYFRQFLLLKDIGLTKKVGTGAVIRMFMLFTLSGELLAAAAILILNALNVTRINDIFKYMELPGVLMLFAVHFAAALITLLAILSSLNKNVFASRGSADDLGIRKMEVSVQ